MYKEPNFVLIDKNFYEKKERYSPPKKINYINDYTTNDYKNIFCANCGEKGHVVKECERPITSFGIIAIKIIHNKQEELQDKNTYLSDLVDNVDLNDSYPKIKYLLIQRKDTMGYIDFMRGKYSNNDIEKYIKINTCLNEMTFVEKQKLLDNTFTENWNDLWVNHKSKAYLNEYENAKKRYNKLDIKNLVKNSKTIYTFQEFSFPKGRKNLKEKNINCAEREFFEETGYDKSTYDFIKNYPIIQEEFMGTNKVKYRHTYYLVKMKNNINPPKVDINNKCQTGEVRNIGWFTYKESLSLIRPYDTAKKNVLIKINNDLVKMNFNFQCSSYYINYNNNNYYKNWNYHNNYNNSYNNTYNNNNNHNNTYNNHNNQLINQFIDKK
jgi:8-oxo-dGTP pyrophosphatase MutT (NUDIX family)